MKLWQGEGSIDEIIEKFTIGQDHVLDLELARYDVIGSRAHTKMLHSIGLLTRNELIAIHEQFDNILAEIDSGNFRINDGIEDVHSQIELLLTKELGEVGKKIHSGRSRNDQVLVDLKLYYRDKIDAFAEILEELINSLIHISEKYKNHLMPGYTHTQVGMVSSFGMWFGSFAEALIDDYRMLGMTKKTINQNPLGSAAGYGNSFPLDRQETTDILNFDQLCINSMYAQLTRGKSEIVLSQSIANICFTLGKFASDVCLFNNQDFGLVKLPEALTTGSSIMPHKKNPDVLELVRAKCNQIISLPNQLFLICNNLISGYHRDFQQLKEILFPSLHMFEDILNIVSYVVTKLEPNENIIDHPKYDALFTVEAVNKLVLEGVAFREAYQTIKKKIEADEFVADKHLSHTHIGSIGNLSNDKILQKLRKASLEYSSN